MLGSLFIKSSAARKYKWVKAFLQNIRTYKKSGVRLREAQLLSPNGELMTKYGEATITDNDVMMLRDILLYQPGCADVLHLDKLYYCVKALTEQLIVLFNGSNYIIACVTDTEHTILVNIKARKLDCDDTILWVLTLADKLQQKYK